MRARGRGGRGTIAAALVALTLGAGACACGHASNDRASVASAPAAASASAPRSAPVVVTIVVDQLAAWVAAQRWPLLPERGGFRRLAREGTTVRALEYDHAVTDTAPGHAALYTGAVPRDAGIFGNEVVDARGDVVSILRDERTKNVFPGAGEPGASSSPARLERPTLADALRSAHDDAFVISLSLKDRGAILPAGRRPTAAVWLDVKRARFVTSSAYADRLPPWVERHGSRDAVLAALRAPWERTWLDAPVRTPDDQRGEGDESGLGRTFPHRTDASPAPGRVFRTTPASDDTLLAMGLDAIAAAPPNVPILLELSLSANDYVGHVFGPDSWEAWEELARLDAALARFFAALDARFGEAGWSAMLSADHGTSSMPEVAANAGVRIDLEDLTAALKTAAERALPARPDLVRGVADPYVFVGDGARALSAADHAKLDRALRDVLEHTAGMRRVFAVDDLPAECPPSEGDAALAEEQRIAALVCRSVRPRTGEHAGGYYLVTKPGSFFDARIVRGFGTSHGSPYVYDRTVPFVVRAPGRVRAGVVVTERVDFRAFARTGAALFGIAPPAAAAPGRDLTQ